jgi:two-component system, chemotaxis family, chemotaxis protein CheY
MQKILIVDDSAQMRKALKDILKQHPCEIVGEANNGIEAIKLFKTLSPDIILLDIMLPQLNGIETLRLLRSLDKDVIIIMISAIDSFDRVQDCMKAGANHYILKPFEKDKVIGIISKSARNPIQ